MKIGFPLGRTVYTVSPFIKHLPPLWDRFIVVPAYADYWGIFQFSKLTRFDFRVPGIHSSIVPTGSGFAINYSCHVDNSKKLVFRLFSFFIFLAK